VRLARRPRLLRRTWPVAVVSVVLFAAGSLSAQTIAGDPQAAPDDPRSTPVAGDDDLSRVDLIDLMHHVFGGANEPTKSETHQGVTLAVVPVIGAQPHVGFKAGVGASFEFPLGTSRETRFSSLNTSITFSTNKQLGASLNPLIYGSENAWKIEGRNSYTEKTTDNVALGTSSVADESLSIDFHSTRVIDRIYLRAWRQLYLGGGFVYVGQRNIQLPGTSGGSPFESYSAANGFSTSGETSAGGTIAFLFDNRDNPNDAIHGWYASAAFHRYFAGFLGGDSDWQELFGELRTYRALTSDKRHKLAFWTFGDFVTSGVAPYLSLPTTAGDPDGRSARGYAEGRFRGERIVYGEAEYRGLVTPKGLVGIVSFVNVATMTNQETGERLFHSTAFGGGGGVRLLFRKRSRANICLDAGFGRTGSKGIYLGLNDAF